MMRVSPSVLAQPPFTSSLQFLSFTALEQHPQSHHQLSKALSSKVQHRPLQLLLSSLLAILIEAHHRSCLQLYLEEKH